MLPILHGDQLIGRVDPAVDRKQRQLILRVVHPEKRTATRTSGDAIAEAIQELASFVALNA